MSARFPAPCPSSKMIAANHSWCGFAPFNFPGFAATYNGNSITSGSAPTSLGQLVLSLFTNGGLGIGGTGYWAYKLTTALPGGWPAIDPQIDSVGSALSFPNLVPGGAQFNGGASIAGHGGTGSYTLTGLVVGLTYGYTLNDFDTSVDGDSSPTGTFTAASTSTTITCVNTSSVSSPIDVESVVSLAPATRHFTLWDYTMISPDTASSESGPTAYPLIDVNTGSDYLNGYNREVWGAGLGGGAAYLELTITNDFSGLASMPGSPGSDVIVETYTVNKYTAAITDSGPSPTPSSTEKAYMFPLPGHYDVSFYEDGVYPILISVTASATELVFELAYSEYVSGTPTLFTFTQTLQLAAEYDLATAITDTTTLLNANAGSQADEFAALSYGQLATCTYNSDGTVHVVVSAIGTTASTPTLCGGGVPAGSPATAATGYAFNALSNGKGIAMGTAFIDVCGTYCLRTFHCTGTGGGVVDCASGTVDGYAPVTIAVPTLPSGETEVWEFLFPNCTCT